MLEYLAVYIYMFCSPGLLYKTDLFCFPLTAFKLCIKIKDDFVVTVNNNYFSNTKINFSKITKYIFHNSKIFNI